MYFVNTITILWHTFQVIWFYKIIVKFWNIGAVSWTTQARQYLVPHVHSMSAFLSPISSISSHSTPSIWGIYLLNSGQPSTSSKSSFLRAFSSLPYSRIYTFRCFIPIFMLENLWHRPILIVSCRAYYIVNSFLKCPHPVLKPISRDKRG